MRRRVFIGLIGSSAAWALSVRAEPAPSVRRVALLMLFDEKNPDAQAVLAVFREELRTFGWIEGRNIKFEYRWVGTDTVATQQAAKDLVALQPDLLVSSSSPTTVSLLRETHTIPIVFVQVVDPVGQHFVASLSRPGGNATGLANLETSMAGKWLELLKQVVPNLARVVIPFNPASTPYADLYLTHFKSEAPPLGIEAIAAPVADMVEFDAAVAAQATQPNTAFAPMPSAFVTEHAKEIAAMMTRYRMPALYPIRVFADAGGLLSYGNDLTDNWRQSASFVDRILKGEKPSDLPVRFPVKFSLVINIKTANSFGLAIPASLLSTADDLIE
jgi:putative tryptophan/tyrosine transport system substrate-binding protein